MSPPRGSEHWRFEYFVDTEARSTGHEQILKEYPFPMEYAAEPRFVLLEPRCSFLRIEGPRVSPSPALRALDNNSELQITVSLKDPGAPLDFILCYIR